jgi:hypothetical protein
MNTIEMKHPIDEQRTLSLFDKHARHEKGSREWNAFSSVQEDSVGIFRVATPHKPLVIKSQRNLLRIIPLQRHVTY